MSLRRVSTRARRGRRKELHCPDSRAGPDIQYIMTLTDRSQVESALEGHEVHVMGQILQLVRDVVVWSLSSVSLVNPPASGDARLITQYSPSRNA
jgi:hypothetical protein